MISMFTRWVSFAIFFAFGFPLLGNDAYSFFHENILGTSLDLRVADAADDAEMDDIYETERRLLYVACTRARDRLMVSGVEPASEYLTDMIAGR